MSPSSPPLVLLHGFLGSPALWEPALATAALAPLAARAHIPWLPGHGPDPWCPAGDFAAVIDALAERLPAGALLVGYSLGARVALSLLARHPERWCGAVALGAHPGLDDARERQERAAWDEDQAQQLERDGLAAFVERWEALPLFATQRALPAGRLASQRAFRLSHHAPSVAWSMRALGLAAMPSTWEPLARSERPLWLLTGALDDKFTRLAAQAAQRWPAARVATVPGAGHNLPLEAPAAVAASVLHAVEEITHKGSIMSADNRHRGPA